MAKKRVSDTISQQQKARQGFLELKKMQTGEMAPEPKPSEVAVVPKTFKEKLQHFWFYFKWQVIGVIASILIIAVLITQCANKTNWDLMVVYFSYTPVIDEQLEPVSDYFESIAEDLNGDGKVNVNIINCSTPNENSQFKTGMMQKLQNMIVAESKAVLYITDGQAKEYFEVQSIKNLFTEWHPLSEEFYADVKTESLGELPKDLQIGYRNAQGTLLEKDKEVKAIQDEAIRIYEKLK